MEFLDNYMRYTNTVPGIHRPAIIVNYYYYRSHVIPFDEIKTCVDLICTLREGK